MEQKFKVPLFDRTRNGAYLTPQGEVLLKQAETVFKAIQKMDYFLEDQVTDLDGSIHIASYHAVIQNWLPKFIASFSEENPKVTFILEGGATRRALQQIRTGEADFAILDLSETPPDLNFVDLFVTRLMLIASKELATKLTKKPNLTEISKLPQVAFPMYSMTTPRVKSRFSKLGLKLSVRLTTNNFQALKLYTQQGIGIAFIDEFHLSKEDYDLFKVFPLDDYFETSKFGVVFKKSKHFSPSVHAFLNSIKPDFPFP